MGKVKRLELWWQPYLYVTTGSGLRKNPPTDFSACECTKLSVHYLENPQHSRQNGSLWKFYVPLRINNLTAFCDNSTYYCRWETQADFSFRRHMMERLINLPKSFYFTERPWREMIPYVGSIFRIFHKSARTQHRSFYHISRWVPSLHILITDMQAVYNAQTITLQKSIDKLIDYLVSNNTRSTSLTHRIAI
jgi:hypothetical protein